MLKVNFVHLCEFASLSEGKLNVLGVLEGMNVQSFPISFPQLYIVTNISFLEPSLNDVNQEIQLVSPDGNIVAKYSLSFPVKEINRRFGTIGQLLNVSITESGKYTLKVLINGDEVSADEIQIVKQ
jgi:hypothetical protein